MPNVLIDIEARYAQALDGLNRVSTAGEQAAKRLDSAFSVLKAGAAGLVAGLSVDALVGGFRNVVNSMDALNDASDRTGSSVEDLSSLLNTLKPYGGTLEGISDATSKLAKAMGEAGDKGSKQGEAFKALGISTKDAQGNLRGTVDVLEDVARAIGGYADGTNKTVLAQALFGKSGAELLPMLKDLANAERQAASVTTEAAAQAERLNVAFGTLKVSSEAFWQSLASKIVPDLARMAEAFAKARTAGLSFFDSLNQIPFATASDPTGLQGLLQGREDALNKLLKEESKIRETMRRNDASVAGRNAFAFEDAKRRLEALTPQIQKARDNLQLALDTTRREQGSGFKPTAPAPSISGGSDDKPAVNRVSDGERYLRNLEDQIVRTSELSEAERVLADIRMGRIKFDTEGQQQAAMMTARRLDLLKQETEAGKAAAKEADAAAREQNEEAARFIQAAERRNEQMERQAQIYLDMADPAAKYRRQLEEIAALEARGDLKPGIADLASIQVQRQMNDALDSGNDKLKDNIDLAKDFGVTMTSAFEDAIFAGKGLGDVLKGLAQDLARITLRKSILEPLLGSLLGTGMSAAGQARVADLQSMAGAEAAAMSVKGGPSIVQYITNQGGASPAEMARWGESVKNATIRAVEERQRR